MCKYFRKLFVIFLLIKAPSLTYIITECFVSPSSSPTAYLNPIPEMKFQKGNFENGISKMDFENGNLKVEFRKWNVENGISFACDTFRHYMKY